MQQVPKEHYQFESYTGLDRWSSYYYQVREVLRLAPTSVLEIGGGDGFLKRYLQGATAIDYINLDIASDLNPVVVGSAESIPLVDDAVDMTVAFEVLEHLPFEKFEPALRELRRVSKRFVVISLPHSGPQLKLSVKLPRLRAMQLAIKLPLPKRHVFNGEHYWEIGKRGYPLSRIRGITGRVLNLDRDFIPFESGYHHFFVLRK